MTKYILQLPTAKQILPRGVSEVDWATWACLDQGKSSKRLRIAKQTVPVKGRLSGICLALLLILCPYQATASLLTRKLAKNHEKNASAGLCVGSGRIKTLPRRPKSLPLWPFGLDQV